jgi:pimeloyl-ACP methyl ester carboxylesterase
MAPAMRRRSLAAAVAVTMLLGVLAFVVRSHADAAAPATKPTIVLVHGAWANTESWSGVIARLQSEGYTVDAPLNPLRSLRGDAATQPGSALGAGPTKVFNFVPYPGAPKDDALLYVKPAVFDQAFANGLPGREGAVLAATQAPAAYSALTAPSGAPAWKTTPSWYVLGTIDRAIPPAIQLFMARRIHAHIRRLHAGHLSMIADPAAVAKVITAAARATA